MTNDIPAIPKTSIDTLAELKAKLSGIHPGLFDADGNLVKDEFEKIATNFKATDEREKYEFSWTGKTASKRIAYMPSKATLRPNRSRSQNFEHTANAIIEGDNLEVLKLLQKGYSKQVKCIYIDPPYNTGNDFVYRDNYSSTREVYWREAGYKSADGIRLDSNSETNGRYHSDWLSMMQSRLLLARQLLRDDGVIFVSIDDNEVHNLRKLMDEVFGPENFVGQIVVQTNPRGRSLDRHLAKTFEYLLLYSKNYEEAGIYQIGKSEEKLAEYNKEDEEGRYRELELRNRNPVFNRSNRPNLYFPIYIAPSSGKVSLQKSDIYSQEALPLNSKKVDGCWTWGKDKVVKDGNLLVGKKVGTGAWRVYRKDYIPLEGATTKEKSLWVETNLNHENGKEEIGRLLGGAPFDFPKSVHLLSRIVAMSTKGHNHDLILDFFAGSGTTAQSVMELNAVDGGNRRYILVQMPEAIEEKSDAYIAGYKTISQICIERVKRAGAKIVKDGVDTGFKVFELSASNFPENNFIPDAHKTPAENTKLFDLYVQQASQASIFDADQIDLLTEIALKDGFILSHTISEEKEFKHNRVVRMDDGAKSALICIDNTLDPITIEQLRQHAGIRFICLEAALDTSKKWTLKQIFASNLWVA